MKTLPTLAASAMAALLLSGCAQLSYYAQAMRGQMSLLSSARPIDDWLADPGVNDDLKARLKKTQQIRAFAAKELGLPDNGSYKSYADLKRPYVMWNVVATQELSMKPVQWCFPIAGCVDYRGYYSKEAAQELASQMRAQGYDVRVNGVPAYSTLGWFNDPVLSTFIEYPEAEVARMVFHELAHQVAYAPGDSQFNESFATSVEEVGVERWLNAQHDPSLRERYAAWRRHKEDFLDLLARYRRQLDDNYGSSASDAVKRERKAQIFMRLKEEYESMKAARWGGYAGYDRWFGERMTNAHFALISTYHDLVPAFRAMLNKEKHLPAYYQSVRKLAKMNKVDRRKALAAYLPPDSPYLRTLESAGINTTVTPTAAMQ